HRDQRKLCGPQDSSDRGHNEEYLVQADSDGRSEDGFHRFRWEAGRGVLAKGTRNPSEAAGARRGISIRSPVGKSPANLELPDTCHRSHESRAVALHNKRGKVPTALPG